MISSNSINRDLENNIESSRQGRSFSERNFLEALPLRKEKLI